VCVWRFRADNRETDRKRKGEINGPMCTMNYIDMSVGCASSVCLSSVQQRSSQDLSLIISWYARAINGKPCRNCVRAQYLPLVIKSAAINNQKSKQSISWLTVKTTHGMTTNLPTTRAACCVRVATTQCYTHGISLLFQQTKFGLLGRLRCSVFN
jgi:hypothetical protein